MRTDMFFSICIVFFYLAPILVIASIIIILIIVNKKNKKHMAENGRWADAKIMFIDYRQETPVYDVMYTDIDGFIRTGRCFGTYNHNEGDVIRIRYAPPKYDIVESMDFIQERRKMFSS